MPQPTPEGQHLVSKLDHLSQLLTQRRRIRLLLRACWITALVIAACLAVRTWSKLDLAYTQVGLVGGLTFLIGVVYAAMPAYKTAQISAVLDRHFGLDQQLSTALELNLQADRVGWSQLLTNQANLLADKMYPKVVARSAEPLKLEAQTLAIALGLCFSMIVLSNIGQPLATNQQVAQLPEITTLETAIEPPSQLDSEDELVNNEPTGPNGERPAGGEQGSELTDNPEGQAVAEALSDALRDNATTRAAADALDRGATGQAADAIRNLADQADQLSQASRNQIADSLEQAASDLQNTQPDQAQALRNQAQQIREGGTQTVEGLEELARTIDELGGDPAPNNPLAGSQESAEQSTTGEPGQNPGEQQSQNSSTDGAGTGSGLQNAQNSRSSPPANQPGRNDVPLPPSAEQPTEDETTSGTNNAPASISLPGGSGSGGGNGGSGRGQVPDDIADPAIIPPELRDAIQDYFQH